MTGAGIEGLSAEDQKLRKAEDQRPKTGNQKNIEPQTQGKVEIDKERQCPDGHTTNGLLPEAGGFNDLNACNAINDLNDPTHCMLFSFAACLFGNDRNVGIVDNGAYPIHHFIL